MIENILGPVIDIHGGGQDLVRPCCALKLALRVSRACR
jgi:cysteinyl-tRNA synthetase